MARIACHARTSPDDVAIVDGDSRLTYADLDGKSGALAACLREAGVQPGNCVGILLERSAGFVAAALGVMKAGAAYLPLDASTPPERLAFILDNAGATLLLAHRNKAKDLPAGTWRAIDPEGPEVAASRLVSAPDGAELPDLAYIVYTSGSTGQPKGVEITHANLLNLIDWHVAAFGVTPSARAAQVAGLGFDAAAWEIWPTLAAGAALYIADELTRRSPQALRDWLVREKITISFVPTVLAEQLLHTSWPADTALRTMLTGADTLHRRPAAGLPFALVNNYGPTECTVVSTSGIVAPVNGTATNAAEGPPSIGRPITNATALILDPDLRPVPPGEPGELCLGGALVGRGYRNDPQLTASRFVTYTLASGPALRIYRTGDRARMLPNGEIAFMGRLDDQIKIRGYRVEPGEIVACLDRYPTIQASAVVVRNGPLGQAPEEPALVAYVVVEGAARPAASDLREYLAARLPDYMIPTRYVALASLPMTANGKLDKSALPAPTAANLLLDAHVAKAAAPANSADKADSAVESRLIAVIASLLGQPTVARDQNFFLIGGHSMLGVQLVARIRDAFGVKLALRQLFSAPTAAALSAEVSRLLESAGK
jgi:amino acid adenylation domain-containing protein